MEISACSVCKMSDMVLNLKTNRQFPGTDMVIYKNWYFSHSKTNKQWSVLVSELDDPVWTAC